MTQLVYYDGDVDQGEIHFHPKDHPKYGVSLQVQFQHGPVGDNGVNGVQNEQVIELLVMRLRDLNSKFPCRENSIAITKLEEAMMWLEKRTAARVAQGVEGKNEPHDDGGGGPQPAGHIPASSPVPNTPERA